MKSNLSEIYDRALAADSDRAAWLEARRGVVTATEVKRVALAKTATARRRAVLDIVREKREGSSFAGNQATEWGLLREDIIFVELERRWGFTRLGSLIRASDEQPRHAATPDGISQTLDGAVILAEIKTSKNRIFPGTPEYERAGYEFQMQWQMYVTGAVRCLYVLEQHNGDFSGWTMDRDTWDLATGPEPLPLETVWIDRNNEVIEMLKGYAQEILAELDLDLVEGVETVLDDEIDALAAEVVAGREIENKGKKIKGDAWSALQSVLAERGREFEQAGSARVRYVPAVVEIVEVPDVDAAVAAFPKEWTQLERARKRVEKLEAAWSLLQAGHVMEEQKTGRPSLSVAAIKEQK